MPDRPARVLLITSDQQRWDTLPCYGLDFMHTPNLDRLAREGQVFRYAFTPSPVCQPARASLMTGLDPLTHRVLNNGCWYPPQTPVWVREVGAAGYRTAAIGKMHFYPWNNWGGFQDRIIAEDKRHYYRRDDYTLWLEAHGYRRLHPLNHPGYAEGLGAYASPLPPELHIDSYIGDRGAEWLRAHAHEPFFAWVSFNSPHDPYDPPEDLAGLYRDAPLPPAVGFPGELDTKPEAQRRARERAGANPVYLLDFNRLDHRLVRHLRAHYLATVTLIDRQVGKLLGALEDAGVLDETLVIFTSDHGDALSDHGLVYKSFFYECMVRVPLLVRGPGVPAGVQSDALVDLLDLVPAILRHLGIRFEGPVQGQDLTPLFTDPAAPHRDAVFSVVGDHAMVRTRQWKLARYGNGDGELYDLEADPGEVRNLYGLSQYREAQSELEARLLQHVLARTAASARFTATPPDPERVAVEARIRARDRRPPGTPIG